MWNRLTNTWKKKERFIATISIEESVYSHVNTYKRLGLHDLFGYQPNRVKI